MFELRLPFSCKRVVDQ
jgi:hypothetical protein